jgi:uncharacterized protein YqeY
MSTLFERIGQDITAAMRAKDQTRLAPLRMAKAAMMNKEVEKGRPLEDPEAEQVVASLIKQRRDSIEQFTKGGRQDLVARETAEVAILEAYLPPPADSADVEQAVDAAIVATGATTVKDLGRVMKAVMAGLAGQTVDGKLVNEIVRRRLGA